jgi:hypothetical protein
MQETADDDHNGCDGDCEQQEFLLSPEDFECTPSIFANGFLVSGNLTGKLRESESVWFNSSLEEIVIKYLYREAAQHLGLNLDDSEDMRRFKYFIDQFDLRYYFMELLDPIPEEPTLEEIVSGEAVKIRQDFAIYYFDLELYNVQPGDWIDIFDLSELEEARESGDIELLGDTIRKLVDEMMNNGKPDVVVAYSPNRTKDADFQKILINIFSTNAVFAKSGQALFESYDVFAGKTAEISYPYLNVARISFHFSGVFTDNRPLQFDAECLKTLISGTGYDGYDEQLAYEQYDPFK